MIGYFCEEGTNGGLQTSLNDTFNKLVAQRELITALIRIMICGGVAGGRGIEKEHIWQEPLNVYLWSGDH